MRTLRVTAITMAGVLVSAALGASFLGAFTYVTTQPNVSMFGPYWWKVAALGGAMYAALPGLIVGGAVSLSECGKVSGTLIGGGVGLILTALLLMFTDDFFSRWDSMVVAVAVIPLGAALGFIVAIVSACLNAWQKNRQVSTRFH